MVVVEIRISDELRKDLRAEIRETVEGSFLFKKIERAGKRVGLRYWDNQLNRVKKLHQEFKEKHKTQREDSPSPSDERGLLHSI